MQCGIFAPLRAALGRVPRAGIVTTLLILATFGGVATVAMVIGQSDAKSDVVPTSFTADRGEPDKSRAADQPRIGNPLLAIPIRELTATQDRPLFLPSRRPPALPVVAITSAPPAPPLQPKPAERERPPLLLIGTVAGEIGPIGIFLDQSTNRTISLRAGQRLYGWVLSAVHKREVILRKDQAIVLLPLSAHAIAPVVAVATPISEAEREQHGRR
jgi:general secretion pathway protein N